MAISLFVKAAKMRTSRCNSYHFWQYFITFDRFVNQALCHFIMSYPQKPPKLNHPGSLDIHIMYKQKTRKAEALRELLYLYDYLFIRQLLDALVKTRRRPAGHDADGGSVLILLGAVTILIKLL